MRNFIVIALLSAVGGCGGSKTTSTQTTGDGGTTSLSGLVSIDVEPPTATIAVTNGTAGAPVTFTATGHYQDNHTADITSAVSWALADSTVGSLNANVFTASGARGGNTSLTATADSVVGSAKLDVTWSSTRYSTDDGSTASSSSSSLFTTATTTDSTLAPTLVYPTSGTVLPSNLGALEVQWTPPSGAADTYEVAVEGTDFDLRIYTNAPETTLGGGRISLTADEWTALQMSLSGDNFAITVTGVSSADATKSGASATAGLTLDAQPLQGGIYYWSPTEQGIERHDFADTADKSVDYYGLADSGGHCVACHVLSRDGKKAVVSFDSGAPTSALLDVATKTQTIPASAGLHFDFAGFSPDSNKLIAAHQTGTLSVYDTSGGSSEGQSLFDLAPPAGQWYSQVDWSPDGKSIVFTTTAQANVAADWQFSEGSIVVATGPGDGTFANPTVIVQSMGENNYYPSFSPDNKWILFNRATSGVSYNNAAAESYVVSADGTIGPIALTNANASGDITNSWPRWAPFVQQYADGSTRMYFTFSSTRNYGIELVQSPTALRPQLWMSSFSPAAATAKQDPSAAPFWLPFQDITTSNHIAQWTQTIVAVQ